MWKVHDLSRLTGVSARTLHHYDAIGLLTPSRREANGYRLYSERDLARLQQIVALKFLGFSLKDITGLLKTKGNLQEQLEIQSAMLAHKLEQLRSMQSAVSDILQKARAGHPLHLEQTLKLIEVYRMDAKNGKAWVNQVLENHISSQKIMNERVRSGLTDEVAAEQIAQAQPKLAEFIERATPFIGTDPTTQAAHDLSQEWFVKITEVFGEQIEMVTVLRQRWMLDEAPALPCTKEFAEWMIIAMTCGGIRHSWMAKVFSKEIIVQFADMATKTPFAQTMGRQQAQAALLQEIAEHINEDPASEIGQDIGRRWGALNDEIYGEYPEVKKAMQDAYWSGKMPNAPYTREQAEWIRDAMKAAGVY